MRFLLLAAAVILGAVMLGAAGPVTDPDWPCVQRLVPRLTAGLLWAGPPATANWRDNAEVAALVRKVAPRSVPAARAAAEVGAFADGIPAGARAETLAEVFAGLVAQTNEQRGDVIERLREITRGQRRLAESAERVGAQLNALPDDAPAAQRADLTGQRVLMVREYEEIGRTLRYACEAPVAMEAKLGTLSQAMRQRLQ